MRLPTKTAMIKAQLTQKLPLYLLTPGTAGGTKDAIALKAIDGMQQLSESDLLMLLGFINRLKESR